MKLKKENVDLNAIINDRGKYEDYELGDYIEEILENMLIKELRLNYSTIEDKKWDYLVKELYIKGIYKNTRFTIESKWINEDQYDTNVDCEIEEYANELDDLIWMGEFSTAFEHKLIDHFGGE